MSAIVLRRLAGTMASGEKLSIMLGLSAICAKSQGEAVDWAVPPAGCRGKADLGCALHTP